MKPSFTTLTALALATILSGCLSKAPSHGKIVGQSLPKGTTIPPAWTANTAAGGAVTNDWLQSFHDLQLNALVTEAIAKNLDLSQAAAQLEIVRQNVAIVSSQLKPQVNLGVGVNTVRDANQSSNYNGGRALLGIGWEPDIWGELRAERAAAVEQYRAATLDYAWARQSLAATTAKSWYQAVALQQMIAIQEQTIEAYAELLRLAKAKQAAGQVGSLDVAEAAANLDEAKNVLTKTQGLFSTAQRNLEVLVGRYPAASLDVRRDFAVLPLPVPAGLPSSLLERRPDIAAAERLVLEAFHIHEAAKLALLPSFALTFGGGRLNDSLLALLHLNPWFYHAGLGMNVPIYTGGLLTAQVKLATALQQQSVANYGSAVLNAFQEVEDALTNERILAEQFAYLGSAVKERMDTVRLARIKYTAGASDMLPVLQLETYQYETQIEIIKVRNARLVNNIDLHLALGGSFDAAPARAIP